MNISEKAKELMEALDKGDFGGNEVDVPLIIECDESWTEDYAIMDGMYFDRIVREGKGELNDEQLLSEFITFIKAFFGEVVLIVGMRNELPLPPVGSIVVQYFLEPGELEIYRVT